MLGERMATLWSKEEVRIHRIWELMPELFKDEIKEIELNRQKAELEAYKARFSHGVHLFNMRRKGAD